jgi:hypothetical protein
VTDNLSPEAVAASKRQTMWDIGAQEFMLWMHSPITAGFFQFLADSLVAARESAADFVEGGAVREMGMPTAASLERLRGEILLLRQLHQITVQNIHEFYGKEPPSEDQADQA